MFMHITWRWRILPMVNWRRMRLFVALLLAPLCCSMPRRRYATIEDGLNNLVTICFYIWQAWVVVSNPFDLIGEL